MVRIQSTFIQIGSPLFNWPSSWASPFFSFFKFSFFFFQWHASENSITRMRHTLNRLSGKRGPIKIRGKRGLKCVSKQPWEWLNVIICSECIYQSSFLDGSGTVSWGSPRRYSTLTPNSLGASVERNVNKINWVRENPSSTCVWIRAKIKQRVHKTKWTRYWQQTNCVARRSIKLTQPFRIWIHFCVSLLMFEKVAPIRAPHQRDRPNYYYGLALLIHSI